MPDTDAKWTGEIGCEGGPILVANTDDFRHWHGADPLPLEARRELHFRIVTLADGRRLHAALDPASEYDRAIRDLEFEAVHSFGPNRTCYLWSVEPGLVAVSVNRGHDRLHWAQVNFADGPSDVADAYAYADASAAQTSGLSYAVTSGPVVVAWSPNSVRDLSSPDAASRATTDDIPRILDLATGGSGASLWLDPGSYLASSGYHETEVWGVSWCTLERRAA
ncbi:MAG: hypothetical protein GY769_01980 [bacterium]|nr:hypothetical protein [bacterium]